MQIVASNNKFKFCFWKFSGIFFPIFSICRLFESADAEPVDTEARPTVPVYTNVIQT